MEQFITRFAPSPTGHLHLGHALSAFHVWRDAARAGGAVLLRLEDIDQTRCRPQYEASILADLKWLGLDWSGPVRRQSQHFDEYAADLEALRQRGLIYRCFKTRREIAAALPAGADPDEAGLTGKPLAPAVEASRLARGHAFAWRLSLSAARAELGARYGTLAYTELTPAGPRQVRADPKPFGDVVLARKDTPASYHLACCHDDALQGVTHVTRGEDIRTMTSVHVLLQALMDWPVPVYRFHPLLVGPDGKKLSKRAGDKGLLAWRADGKTPADIRAMTGFE
ncbi:tRNA glutamyl-Q(34) synthetase GluQRS [Hyphomonas johnsonii]|uniref:Glutamyl-Q tRNA(Asp) ligase n=1 Tax=Hyphomonas johnsonii MHS-2 TaxID=1280950 RepID=A0A059FN61_9PROT|nr:tRNA glutamyl-Q(34) synthetase GluQRS [Hyphomonas johnsonii]KCZ92115.1 glutamyl-Q tRNA(Asp) ligase [Hyphomonas johnsonii MHS-2]